jgi:hypothetical protein
VSRLLVRCLLINAAGILASGAILLLSPSQSGFTLTTAKATHYIGGGVLPAVLLMGLLDLGIAISLAWSLLHPS